MDDVRRALIKFDTQNTIPTKSTIQSAVVTLTLKAAGADALRAITVLPVTTSFVQEEAMWNRSRASINWTSAGSDFGPAGAGRAERPAVDAAEDRPDVC